MNERKKFVTLGAIGWVVILITFFVVLPWHDKRKVESTRLKLQFDKLKEVKMLINREAELAVRETFLVGALMNQEEVWYYGRQIVEVQTVLENIAKSKKVKITDTRPVKTSVMREDLGVRKATIRLTATAQDPKKFIEFFVDLDYMPGLLNIEEFSMQRDPKKPKAINFNLCVSTLVKEEK